MGVDISTTHYALSNNLGYEANGFMSGIVSNPILFILIKLIGSMVIIFMMNKILEKNKEWAFRGMRLIILMMLFVVLNNSYIISVSALSFSNFSSSGATGAINTANGFYDDDASGYGYTGDRNIYVVTENTEIWMFEPSCTSSGACSTSGNFKTINSSYGGLEDAVVYRGYLYYLEGNVLKKRSTRGVNSICESSDNTSGGCIINIDSSAKGRTLRVYDDNLYYIRGIKDLYHLDSEDNSVFDFTIPTYATALPSPVGGFTVVSKSGTLHIYTQLILGGGFTSIFDCTSVSCTSLQNVDGSANNYYSTYTNMGIYIYESTFSNGGSNTFVQKILYASNNTLFSSPTYLSSALTLDNRLYVGGRTTLGLSRTATTYDTFNAIGVGVDSLPIISAELTYDTKTISSLDSTYYNRSDIYLQYNVILDSLNANNLLLDFADYRWIISMTDPNGVTTDIIQSPACSYSSLLDITCQVTSTMGIHAPSNGWLAGPWTAKLYEINTVNPSRTLITTSSAFTVLNTSLDNQSIPPPPFIPPTSGTAPQAVSKIDGFVSWLGLGVNSVSKLLFAMIIIAIAATVGLIWGNGNIAMVFAFVPYAFFTFIDYIPKWIFIITIILIAIASRAFR